MRGFGPAPPRPSTSAEASLPSSHTAWRRVRGLPTGRGQAPPACPTPLDASAHTRTDRCTDLPPLFLQTTPHRRRIFTLLRSPHVNKDSREQFETRTHSRLIDISSPTAQTIDSLMSLDIAAGVDVEVKL